ncbi:hypothetical protein IHE45_19G118000 [Dioscorea alata]|uniref:Uncharacterized protein n=1 Tax=Dioscorea alata TaxID=55571 RepID=A0ACB7U169_DIOAL|nr:hypothetical protein IHE45_19G118000 [Dioscorea alata]
MFSSNNKDLQINEDDKFFSKLLSKESSLANQSFRVTVPGSVPFMWESQPGKSKYTNLTTPLLPLTPPPSYYTKAESKVIKKESSKSRLLKAMLHSFTFERKSSMPSSPSAPSASFSSMSSSSSSRFSSTSSSLHERFSSARMSFMPFGEDGELDDQRSKKVSGHGGGGGVFQWCNKIVLVKKTLLMIIGSRSS